MATTARTRRRYVACILRVTVVSLCGASISCSAKRDTTPAPSAQVIVGYSAPELFAAQTAIMHGFVKQAEAKDWKVLVTNANDSAALQDSQIAYFIRKRVSAIVAVPIDSRGIGASVKAAQAAGIPFYTIDRATLDVPVDMCVLSDNYLAGEQAGQHLITSLKKRFGKARGEVLELQGDMRQNVAQLRGGGFHSVVDSYPEVRVTRYETRWLADEHVKGVTRALRGKTLDAIYLHSDNAGVPVILPVLKQLGRLKTRGQVGHIIIVGVDGCPQTLAAIREGHVDESSGQPVPDFGVITDWIQLRFGGIDPNDSTVVHEGALWSPAQVRKTDLGWVLLMRTTAVTIDNVDNPALWGNQP